MIASIIALALAGVAYAPPSNEDARLAITTRLADERYRGDAYKSYGDFPYDVRLLRCEAQDDHEIVLDNGLTMTLAGQQCLLTLAFPSEPAYQVEGFFHFDGVKWEYFGRIYPYGFIGPNTYAIQGDKGGQTPKQGSILYNGRAGVGRIAKPYDKLFTPQDDWVKKPTEQAPHYDPETDKWVRR